MPFERTLTSGGWVVQDDKTVKDSIITVSAAKIASPDADMLADVINTYQLNVPPFTRYRSTGTAMVDESSGTPASATSGPITNTVYNGSGQLTNYRMLSVDHVVSYSTINGSSVPVSDAATGGATRTFNWKNTTPPQFDYES